jgi:endoglucanase
MANIDEEHGMKSLIQKLVETTGPSGYETEVRNLVIDEIEDHVDKYEVDDLGNLITYKGKKEDEGITVMLAAHLDEIGIIVTHVDENGFARFTTIGGVRPRNTAGGRVRFLNGVSGVIGMEGEPGPQTFEDYGERIVSKALDDRIGVAVLIETLKKLDGGPNRIVGVFTVQEEVGVRGATAAAYGVDPDLGIAIDVTKSGDTPKDDTIYVGLGKGPAIKVKDRGMISDPRVVTWMEAGAKRVKIPYQLEILLTGSTDARAIQTSRAGVPAGCVSIPCRYVHTPSEMVDLNDVQNAVKLLVSLLGRQVKL